MNDRIIYFGRYEGWLRWLCRGVRDEDGECMLKAARFFDAMLPSDCIVVPMPSHEGLPKQMAVIAHYCTRSGTGREYWGALRCTPHSPNYIQKKSGVTPEPVEMWLSLSQCPSGKPVYIIDTVISSGVTAASALKVLQNATVVTLAKGRW